MLKGISRLASPELLKILCEMGHGDTVVIADANFPAETYGKRVVRADGIGGAEMLDTVLSLIPLDTYSDKNFILMEVVPGDPVETPIWDVYRDIANKHDKNLRLGNIPRFDFYEEAKKAYCVIATGETAIYANIIIKKGVI
jgi:L-fucose mutarotase